MNEILKSARVEQQAVSESELALINAQALRPLTAEEVFAFKLAACDNQVDRDIERFTDRTLDQLAELFVGRPVLRDHNWSANSQTARVYAGGVEQQGNVKRLILRCYMPRTEQTVPTITAIESGILREASVGVAVKRQLCSVCEEDYYSCRHRRGEEYEGKMCYVDLDEAAEAFEVSLVAVPAQREAGVVKRYEDKESKMSSPGEGEPAPEDKLRLAQAMQEQEEKRYGGMEE